MTGSNLHERVLPTLEFGITGVGGVVEVVNGVNGQEALKRSERSGEGRINASPESCPSQKANQAWSQTFKESLTPGKASEGVSYL